MPSLTAQVLGATQSKAGCGGVQPDSPQIWPMEDERWENLQLKNSHWDGKSRAGERL